jgi:hypothetical protein
MNMKRRFTIAILILILLSILISGCSAKPASVQSNPSTLENAAAKSDSVATSGSGNTAVDPMKKVIKDAVVALTVKNAETSYNGITAWAAANGASEYSRSITASGQNKRIHTVFKVAPDKLDAFLAYLDGTGDVTSSDTKSTDITDQYYDAQARLDNLKSGRDKLLEIQNKAVTIAETLQVQDKLNVITGEIEALAGKIKLWNSLMAESTVTISITETTDPLKAAKPVTWKFNSISDIGQTIRNGFMTTVNILGNVLVWLVIIIASISPLILIAVIVIIIMKKRKKAKK